MTLFSKSFEVRWSDVDPNMHLKQTAYIEYTDHVRTSFFAAQGFPLTKLWASQIGPITFKLEANYKREVMLGEVVSVNLKLDNLSEDNRKWTFSHDVIKENGDLSCIVTVHGAWLDLKARKIIPAPPEITEIVTSYGKSV